MCDLIDNFPRMLGRPARLLFSRPDWDVVVGRPSARKILASRGTVKVGSFPGDDTHLMVVVMESGERIHLLVIPSTCESDTADLLMGQATDERNTLSAASLLASAKRITGDVALQTSAWESEGGAAGREREDDRRAGWRWPLVGPGAARLASDGLREPLASAWERFAIADGR